MLKAIILVCAATTAPENCSPTTAVDEIRTPILSGSPSTCFMEAQAFLGETDIPLREGDWIRIACIKSK